MSTAKRGWTLNQDREWDGKDKLFKFCVSGLLDSDYAKCPNTRRNVSRYATFLEGAPITVKSVMQKIVVLGSRDDCGISMRTKYAVLYWRAWDYKWSF